MRRPFDTRYYWIERGTGLFIVQMLDWGEVTGVGTGV